jgi:hypothetical protein
MFEEWRQFTEKAKLIPGTLSFRVGSYVSFRNYTRILHSLGLIRLVKMAPGPRKNMPTQFQRHYYALNPGLEKSTKWLHPMQARYPSTNWANKEVFPTERKKAIRQETKVRRKARKKQLAG